MNLNWLNDMEEPEIRKSILRLLLDVPDTNCSLLGRDEAIRRATVLVGSILEGRIRPSEFEMESDGMEVVYALAYHVLPCMNGSPAERTARIAAVRRFLEEVDWGADPIGERSEILGQCDQVARATYEYQRDVEPSCEDSYLAEQAVSYGEESGVYAGPDEEVLRFLEEKAQFVRLVFTEIHGFSEDEAEALGHELKSWFLRFCRRETAWVHRPRAFLFAAACQLARGYEDFRGRGARDAETARKTLEFTESMLAVLDTQRDTARSRE